MNSRERFKKICSFERPNDIFTFGLFCWNETYDRWLEEGMPVRNMENVKEVNSLFLGQQGQNEAIAPNGAIQGLGKNLNPPWAPPLVPLYDVELVKDEGDYIQLIEADGALVRRRKGDFESMPQYLRYPVTDKKSWDEYKKRLDPSSQERFPEDWDIMSDEGMMWPIKPEHVGKKWSERDFPLGMFAYSLCGMPRNYMGLENFSYAMFEDMDLILEMLDWQSYLAYELLKKVFDAGVELEWTWVWEDLCFNTGPLVNPKFVKEFMIPRYRKVIDLMHSNGVDAIILDCDGNLDELLPLWLDAGINATYPLECASGMDARHVRKKFGKDLIMFGNIDKRSLAKGKAEIDIEVAKAKELLAMGGYFPGCDHHVPPDVPYENMKYFMNELYKLSDYPELRRIIV